MKVNEDSLQPMCEMRFFAVPAGTCVDVKLWAPAYDDVTNQYYCKVCIEGIGENRNEVIFSESQFGALRMSMRYISAAFDRSEVEYRTEGRDMPHMYFPQEIPWVYGSDVYFRLCAMVDAEVQKLEDELSCRREADWDWN